MLDKEILDFIRSCPDGLDNWLINDNDWTSTLDFTDSYKVIVSRRGEQVGAVVEHVRFGTLQQWTPAANTPAAKRQALQFVVDHITGITPTI